MPICLTNLKKDHFRPSRPSPRCLKTMVLHARMMYMPISITWGFQGNGHEAPLVVVITHPHFCDHPRRCEWNPKATLSSNEHNWPIIPGPKSIVVELQGNLPAMFSYSYSQPRPCLPSMWPLTWTSFTKTITNSYYCSSCINDPQDGRD